MILSLVILNGQFLVRSILACLQKSCRMQLQLPTLDVVCKGNRNDSYANAAPVAIRKGEQKCFALPTGVGSASAPSAPSAPGVKTKAI